MAPHRIWIMDGHNMIFAIPPLQQLQVSDRREEARSGLTDRLEQFALSRSEKVLVVFDGNELPSSPAGARTPLFETVYAARGEGAADARIIREAGRCLERGLAVTVVTNDMNTLARNLPRAVRHLGVQEFWLKHIEKEPGESGKRVEGDFSDVEREMLTRAAMTEPAFEASEPAPPPARTGRWTAASQGARPRAGAAAEETARDRLQRKRERGRLRQDRRLKRRAKPKPRR
jgi:predicted RNA-binding protein with PIN domain